MIVPQPCRLGESAVCVAGPLHQVFLSGTAIAAAKHTRNCAVWFEPASPERSGWFRDRRDWASRPCDQSLRRDPSDSSDNDERGGLKVGTVAKSARDAPELPGLASSTREICATREAANSTLLTPFWVTVTQIPNEVILHPSEPGWTLACVLERIYPTGGHIASSGVYRTSDVTFADINPIDVLGVSYHGHDG